MLKLQGNEVIYNNSENLGALETLRYIEEGFSIVTSSGSIVYVPEQDCSPNEKEVFEKYHEFYKFTGGIPPKEYVPPVVQPPSQEERIAALEAAIAALMKLPEV